VKNQLSLVNFFGVQLKIDGLTSPFLWLFRMMASVAWISNMHGEMVLVYCIFSTRFTNIFWRWIQLDLEKDQLILDLDSLNQTKFILFWTTKWKILFQMPDNTTQTISTDLLLPTLEWVWPDSESYDTIPF